MVNRCHVPTDPSWARYGGAGIVVCDRWRGRRGLLNFVADMGLRPEGRSIDRYPKQRGNYEPGNCRWATSIEQHNNERRNRNVTAFGKTLTVAAWAREFGMNKGTIYQRLDNGWEPEQALLVRPERRRTARAT
jgi:hypothetical protein